MRLSRRVVWLDRARRAAGGGIATMDLADIPAARADRLPHVPLLDPLVQRAGLWLFGRPHPQVRTTERTIALPDVELTVRIHQPPLGAGPRPLIVHLHGGGWVLGSTAGYDALCTTLAHGLGAVVVSVDYRMAPEHRAPTAVEDAIAATAWLARHPADLGADADAKVAVIGDSAGGNLAALVAIAARDGAVPPLAAQVLIYPATDLTRSSASMRELTDAPLLPRDDIDRFFALYLGDGDGDGAEAGAGVGGSSGGSGGGSGGSRLAPDDPRISPAFAADLAGVAPALVLTAEHDPLRDEGIAYAQLLADAGVPMRHTTYVGVPHGFLSVPGVCPSAAQAEAEILDELRRHLSG